MSGVGRTGSIVLSVSPLAVLLSTTLNACGSFTRCEEDYPEGLGWQVDAEFDAADARDAGGVLTIPDPECLRLCGADAIGCVAQPTDPGAVICTPRKHYTCQ